MADTCPALVPLGGLLMFRVCDMPLSEGIQGRARVDLVVGWTTVAGIMQDFAGAKGQARFALGTSSQCDG